MFQQGSQAKVTTQSAPKVFQLNVFKVSKVALHILAQGPKPRFLEGCQGLVLIYRNYLC